MIPLLITVHTSAILNFEAPMCVRDGMCVSFGIGGTILILWIFPQEGVVSVVGACMVPGYLVSVVVLLEVLRVKRTYTLCLYSRCSTTACVPGGLVGGPRAHQDQFRGFKSHRVHARRGPFSCIKKCLLIRIVVESARA